jgi:hypothetical protein
MATKMKTSSTKLEHLPALEGSTWGREESSSLRNDLIEADPASRELEVALEGMGQAAQVRREERVVVDEEDMFISATEETHQTLDG